MAEHFRNKQLIEFLEKVARPIWFEHRRGRFKVRQTTDAAAHRFSQSGAPSIQIPREKIGFEEVGYTTVLKTAAAFQLRQFVFDAQIIQRGQPPYK